MTGAFLGTPSVLAALGGHRVLREHHGARFIFLVIIVAAVVGGLVLLSRRRRANRPIDDTPVVRQSQDLSPIPFVNEPISGEVRASEPESITRAQPVTSGAPKVMPSGHYDLFGLFRSEWTKLRTVRSTMWTLGVTVVLGIGISALATAETRAHWATMSLGSRLSFDPTATSLIGVFVGQFAIGILGVLVMSGEYGTGTIRATFSAAPRRPLVLVAKATVFGAIALIVAEVVSFVAFFLGQALLSAPAVHTTIGSPGALRAVAGSGLYICVLGLLALGLATIIRHTAGAISAFVGILLVLPLIIQALPSSIVFDVRPYLPDRIGADMIMNSAFPGALSPWIGLLVLCGYAATALLIGAVLLVRRDA